MATNGLIILYKEEGYTSQRAVSAVKRLLGVSKAGHTGTLDPMATGVLPIMLGNATAAGEFMLSSRKHYRAVLRLGLTTDTEDITGEVLSVSDRLPNREQVEQVLARFRGDILQTPPMYSALKVGGKKLVDLAREGVVLEREPRPITVYRLEAVPTKEAGCYGLFVECSKGTYIRTLCHDIGAALGCGGVMAALERVEASGFGKEEAVTLTALEEMSPSEREALVVPVERVFSHWKRVELPPFFARLAGGGCPISLKKLGLSLAVGERVSLYREGRFFAIGETVAENSQLPGTGPAIKPIRQFP